MNEVPTIQASNFTLREIDLVKDKENLISNMNDSEVMKWLFLTYPYDREKDWDSLIQYLEDDKTYYFTIDINGKAAGSISFDIGSKPPKPYSHIIEMGYFLGKDHWGKGIMSEALKLVTKFAFEELKIHKINVPLFAENIGSKKVLEKNGYKLEATLKDNLFKHGSYHDELIFTKFNNN